jgi:hypothetical protein
MADKDMIGRIYEDLKREYDLTLDRRKTLGGQATGLMAFAAIIETVLIGLMVAMATNNDVRSILQNSPYYQLLIVLGGVGFTSYIITAILALLAFREPKWQRVPKMPDPNPIDSIIYFFKHPEHYDLGKFALQLNEATMFHQRTNTRKYNYLKFALIFLLSGIVSTALIGFILLIIAR